MYYTCRKMTFLLLISALTPINMVYAQTSPASMTLDSIVAVVDSDVILSSELAFAVSNIKKQYAAQAGQLPPDNILERQVNYFNNGCVKAISRAEFKLARMKLNK